MGGPEGLGDELGERFHSDPWALADALGVLVLRRPLAGRVRELYVNVEDVAAVILSEHLDGRSARELLAHGLSHHLLHVPSDPRERRVVGTPAEEREADHFAASFLMPEDRLRSLFRRRPRASVRDVAARFDVSPGLVAERIAAAQAGRSLTAFNGIE